MSVYYLLVCVCVCVLHFKWPICFPLSWDSVFELSADKPAESFTAGKQAGYQLAALGVTLLFALVGGVVTGFIMKIPIWGAQQGFSHQIIFIESMFMCIPDTRCGRLLKQVRIPDKRVSARLSVRPSTRPSVIERPLAAASKGRVHPVIYLVISILVVFVCLFFRCDRASTYKSASIPPQVRRSVDL